LIKKGITNLIFELIALGTIITIASIVFVSIDNSLNSLENTYSNTALKLKVMCIVDSNSTYILLYNYGNEPYIIERIQDLENELMDEVFIVNGGELVVKKFNAIDIKLPITIHVESTSITLHSCIDVSEIISQG